MSRPSRMFLRGGFAAGLVLTAAGAVSAQGASAQEASEESHWAYQKPARPVVPPATDPEWAQSPVDAFVLQALDRSGLRPSPRAEPARLLRRLHLDLIGLPPSPAEVDAFLAAGASDAAYRAVVDRLLASPRFGEHWARHWLDLARYADSNGYQADQLRDSWAYRDWVIDAFNDGMPFDQFSIEQLAGDLLEDPTLEQRIATGFHRTVMCNVEAGVHPEANRVDQVADRVNTTATVWLGTTMECAQCHNHKYDPFSQREYYRLFAFFNNTPIEVENPNGEVGVQFDFAGPWLDLPLPEHEQEKLDALTRKRADLEQQRAAALATAERAQPEWERELVARFRAAPQWDVLDVAAFESTGGEDATILDDGSVLIGGRVPDTTTYTVRVDTDLLGITAFRLEVMTHPSLPGTGPGRGDEERPNFILSEFEAQARARKSRPSEAGGEADGVADGDGPESRAVELHGARADHSQRNWPVTAAIDGKPDKGWAIGGGFFAPHAATFLTREPVGDARGTTLTFTLDQNYGRGRTIGRFRLSAYRGDPELLAIPADVVRLLTQRPRGQKGERRLRDYYIANHPAASRLGRQLAQVERQLARIEPDRTLVMVEQEQPRPTHVMRRGDYLQPGDPVAPGTPSVLHPFAAEWPQNRLGLARWLVSRDNPLTARVTVNRWWSHVFGRGLVATEEDFGLRSEPPTHPELLDWLAVEFMESGWSMKHVLRLIVTSATYRQSSRRVPGNVGAVDRDPGNRLLARGPRFRMCAEMIRDNALAAAGLLSLDVAGPPVFPPQPAGLWRQTGRNEPKYVVATGPDRFRRGIYVIWRRAAPYPSFVLFDGPDRSMCQPLRSRTNTPMQALTLMNDEAYVEAALGLARRVVSAGLPVDRTVQASIEHMVRLVLARRPSAVEVRHLAEVFVRERAHYRSDPAAAKQLVGRRPALQIAPELDRVDLAAWFHVAQILLNLDETITKG